MTTADWPHLALTAARSAAAAIASTTVVDAHTKSAPHDLVTAADRAAEAAALATITAARPHDAVLGEETGARAGDTGVRWLIDPLDGTANFVHGRGEHAVSVGVEIDNRIVAGAVLRPSTGEWATGGAGTLRRGRDTDPGPGITTTRRPADHPAEALVTVGMPAPLADRRRVLLMLADLVGHVRGLRIMGCAAGDLLAVAQGSADAFVGFGLAPWDTAGGQALVEAAGGVVSDLDIDGVPVVVAGSRSLVPQLVRLLPSRSP